MRITNCRSVTRAVVLFITTTKNTHYDYDDFPGSSNDRSCCEEACSTLNKEEDSGDINTPSELFLAKQLNKLLLHNLKHHSKASASRLEQIMGAAPWGFVCPSTRNIKDETKTLSVWTGLKTRYRCQDCGVLLCILPRAAENGNMSRLSCKKKWHNARLLRW